MTRVLWCYHVISMGRFMAVFMGYSVTGFLSPYRERFRFCSSAMTSGAERSLPRRVSFD